MEELLMDVNLLALGSGALVAFLLGWVWYSDTLFGIRWREGIAGVTGDRTAMMYGMMAQVFGTVLLAWVIAIAETLESLQFVFLLALTIGTLIKANGLYSQKSRYAICVEVGYIWAMILVMISAHAIF
jgi:hypothetical protein